LGKNNSWAIRWHASAFLKNMLTLYPGKSLVRNIGLDDSGTHSATTSIFDVKLSSDPIVLKRIPLESNLQAYNAYVHFFKSVHEPMHKKILRKSKTLFQLMRKSC
jgi:hypothetical protein